MKYKAGLQKRVSSIFGDTSSPEKNSYSIGVASKLSGGSQGESVGSDSKFRKLGLGRGKNSQSRVAAPKAGSAKVRAVSENEINKQGKSRDKMMLVFMVFLVFVLAAVLGNSFGVFDSKDVIGKKALSIDIPSLKEIDWEIPTEIPEKIRDITSVASASLLHQVGQRIVVRGIIYGEDNSTVIIGNTPYQLGDVVGETKIVAIRRREVEFEKDNKRWTQKVERKHDK